jgi:hypothetical protein
MLCRVDVLCVVLSPVVKGTVIINKLPFDALLCINIEKATFFEFDAPKIVYCTFRQFS